MSSMVLVSAIISLILTASIYGFGPLIFYLKRRNPLQKQTLKAFHIIYTVIIALFFSVANSLNGLSINFAPAVIWGTLFYHINKSKLSDKGLIIPTAEEAPTITNTEEIHISEALDEHPEPCSEIPASKKKAHTVKVRRHADSTAPMSVPVKKVTAPITAAVDTPDRGEPSVAASPTISTQEKRR